MTKINFNQQEQFFDPRHLSPSELKACYDQYEYNQRKKQEIAEYAEQRRIAREYREKCAELVRVPWEVDS